MKETINNLEELSKKIDEAWRILQLDKTKERLCQLEILSSQPEFWENAEQARQLSQEMAGLQAEFLFWQKLKNETADLLSLAKMDEHDKTVNLREDIDARYDILAKQYQQTEIKLLFRGPYDRQSALVSFHAGAGGTDAQDWAEMLLRMILRFCEKKGFQTEILEISQGAEAGIKSCTLQVKGLYAFGYLKSEKGVHRLVRISPFDAEKMRHTSFALIEVMPLFEEVKDVKIKDEDLRIDVFRAGGHGGQNVNKTESAVRITHLPTGIKVVCQNERSQAQNKETALKILKSKLFRYLQEEQEEEKAKIRGEYTEAAWGNQIRSYVLHPYKQVKDHRTKFESKDPQAVLEGDLFDFIEAYLRM